MSRLILLNKPFNALCQFTDPEGRPTLADYVPVPNVYPAGRLDFDSEGLVILTDAGWLQHAIAEPRHKLPKTYWVQVERIPDEIALKRLTSGVMLKDGLTLPAKARNIEPPPVWEREPPIRYRKSIPTAWLELEIIEGKKRQIRRMTAAVGHPTLRLIRAAVGPWTLDELQPGERKEMPCPRDVRELKKIWTRTNADTDYPPTNIAP
ncbi:MAG: pseudouridine synthase [Anaerolineales bacterium]